MIVLPGRSRRLPTLAAVVVIVALPFVWTYPRAQSTQTFRSSVDLIALDVSVADRDGRPVPTLRPDQFQVTLDGQKRRVVSVEFIEHQNEPLSAAWPDSRGPIASVMTGPAPMRPAPPRHFVIVVDAASFRAADAAPAITAARRFVDQLPPSDLVGLYTLPSGANVAPSTNHTAIRQAINTVVGTKRNIGGLFDMTVTEIIDLTSVAATRSLTAMTNERQAGRGSALQDFLGKDNALARVCQGRTDPVACGEMALIDANEAALALEEDLTDRVTSLRTMLRVLQEAPGRKTVVFLSGGLPVSDTIAGRPVLAGELRDLGDQATYSNVTIHTIYFNQAMYESFSANSPRSRAPSARDRNIYTRALSELTEPTGGVFVDAIAGNFESAIDRVLAVSSAYYVLGVEPDRRDRDGRPHQLKVKVTPRDLVVRSREMVVAPQRN